MAAQTPPVSAARTVPVTGLLLLFGLLACVLGLLVTGATAASLVVDPGAVTRWGLPLVRVVSDAAATITVGLLVVAALVLPADGWRRGRTPASARSGVLGGVTEQATRLAALTGGLWVLAGALVVVLTYSQVSGVPPTSARFSDQLSYFVTHLPPLRSLSISVLLAAVAATGAAVATRHTTVAVMAVVSLVALLPIALTGHAAGTASHEVAVDSLAAHLVGVTVWAGGLVALLVVRAGLGTHLGTAARRFSTLALVSFVLVTGSGLVNAWLRLGGWSGVASAYGALLVVKLVLVVALGLAGWTHRRSVLDRLDHLDGRDAAATAGPAARRAFWRLAAGEVALMGAAIGLGVALANSAPPEGAEPVADQALALTGYAMPAAQTAATWFTAWRLDLLWATVAALLLGLYLLGVRRLATRGDRWPLGRIVAWVLGCLVLVYATNGAPGVYGRVLFSSHMFGHMAVSMVVAPLLVLGAPVTLALRSVKGRDDGSRGPREWLLVVVHSRLLAVLGHPLVAAALFTGSLIAFYYSPLFELSLRTHTGHVLMHVHFLFVGYLFASVLIGVDPGPRRPPYPLRLLLLFATMAFHAFFGVALMQGSQLLAPDVLGALGRTWGRTPLADQQLGGAVAWGIGELPVLMMALGIAFSWARSDDRESVRRDRQADRDGEVELTAYNEQLTRLAGRDRD